MKKHLRHILPYLTLAVVVFAGVWLAAPHDICLTKLMAAQGCVCMPDADTGNGCGCCTKIAASIADAACCGGDHTGASDQRKSQDNHAPGCFSISSDLSQVTGPERAPASAPVFAVLAMLPVPGAMVIDNLPCVSHEDVDNVALHPIDLYRDNCVFLI